MQGPRIAAPVIVSFLASPETLATVLKPSTIGRLASQRLLLSSVHVARQQLQLGAECGTLTNQLRLAQLLSSNVAPMNCAASNLTAQGQSESAQSSSKNERETSSSSHGVAVRARLPSSLARKQHFTTHPFHVSQQLQVLQVVLEVLDPLLPPGKPPTAPTPASKFSP